jgi:alkylation response protein AidB-like acyl-CoA dehydrogenase
MLADAGETLPFARFPEAPTPTYESSFEMTSTLSALRSHWNGTANSDERARWDATAESVATALSVDALERDREGRDPVDELALLRDSGLTTLLDPAELGGGGGDWETALRAVRIIAAADASIAQILAYHYVNVAAIAFTADVPNRAEWYRRTIDNLWIWGDAVNPTDPELQLTVDGSGFRLNGLKRFSTGASSGDVTLVIAVIRDGERAGETVSFALDHGRPGISYLGDWDGLGQRLSASGSVRFSDVKVVEDDILGETGGDPFSTLVTPVIQLAFGNIYLGIAQGALRRGIELTRARPNSWFLSSADSYRDDPFVQRAVGEFSSRIAAVEALADRAGRRLDETVSLGHDVTAVIRGDFEIEVARLKVVATEVGLETAGRIFEITGASSASSRVGLDLFWRNIRTHSLHDPVDYKKLEVGGWELNGRFQPVSLYT